MAANHYLGPWSLPKPELPDAAGVAWGGGQGHSREEPLWVQALDLHPSMRFSQCPSGVSTNP